MRNLISYKLPCMDVYRKALSRKHTAGIQDRLRPLEQGITARYDDYEIKFTTNTLEQIAVDKTYTLHKDDLQSLYGFKTATIRKVKDTIDSIQPYTVSNTCQNCTINSVNSMDHVLGQAEFPELAVNPLNLFPSCTQCNNYKSASFVKNGNRRFLNLYTDTLPTERYLFLNIFREADGVLNYNFVLRNTERIDAAKFDLIENHYKELELFSRMKLATVDDYSELRCTIRSRLIDLPMPKVIDQIIREANDNFTNLGHNHFKYVLHMEMIQNAEFLADVVKPEKTIN